MRSSIFSVGRSWGLFVLSELFTLEAEYSHPDSHTAINYPRSALLGGVTAAKCHPGFALRAAWELSQWERQLVWGARYHGVQPWPCRESWGHPGHWYAASLRGGWHLLQAWQKHLFCMSNPVTRGHNLMSTFWVPSGGDLAVFSTEWQHLLWNTLSSQPQWIQRFAPYLYRATLPCAGMWAGPSFSDRKGGRS